MNKKDIQKRVLQNGEPLDLNKFEWKVKVFSTTENGLVLDFQDIDRITFDTGSNCTLDTGHSCTLDTGNGYTIIKDKNIK